MMNEKLEIIRNKILEEVLKSFHLEQNGGNHARLIRKMAQSAVDEVMQGFTPFDIVAAMRFGQRHCAKCGNCCRISDPIIVRQSDVTEIAKFFGIGMIAFMGNFTKTLKDGRVSLKTNPCVFLKDNNCTIYAARPFVCQTFPAVPQNGGLTIYDYCSFLQNLMVTKAKALMLAPFLEARYPELKTIRQQKEKNETEIPKDLQSQLSFADDVLNLGKQVTSKTNHEKGIK